MKEIRDIGISAIIVIGLITAWAIGFISEGREWCERTEKMMKTETLAPAVRAEYREQCE